MAPPWALVVTLGKNRFSKKMLLKKNGSFILSGFKSKAVRMTAAYGWANVVVTKAVYTWSWLWSTLWSDLLGFGVPPPPPLSKILATYLGLFNTKAGQCVIFDPRSLQVRSRTKWSSQLTLSSKKFAIVPSIFVTLSEVSNLVNCMTPWAPLLCLSHALMGL